jgi:hypothetical protein
LWILSNRMIGRKWGLPRYRLFCCCVAVQRFCRDRYRDRHRGIDRFIDHYVPKRGISREDIETRNLYCIGYSKWEINRRETKTKRCEAVVSASSCESSSKWKITRTGMKYVPVEVTYSPKYHTTSSNRERGEQVEGERQRSCVPSGSGLSGASSRFRTAAELDRGCTLMFIDSVIVTSNEPSRSAPILPDT